MLVNVLDDHKKTKVSNLLYNYKFENNDKSLHSKHDSK